jgi:hypothetical protein
MPTNTARPCRLLSRAAASMLLLAAANCAQPPTTASVGIPPIPPQQGRVWFYREVDLYNNPTTPYVRLNGAIAGVPEQGGAFYRDVPPGRYQITVDSEGMSPSPSRDIAVAAGEQVYARIGLGGSWNGQGFTIAVEPSEVGHAAIEHSKFYGANPVGL